MLASRTGRLSFGKETPLPIEIDAWCDPEPVRPFEKQTHALLMPGIKLHILGCPARSLVAVPTVLFRLTVVNYN